MYVELYGLWLKNDVPVIRREDIDSTKFTMFEYSWFNIASEEDALTIHNSSIDIYVYSGTPENCFGYWQIYQ